MIKEAINYVLNKGQEIERGKKENLVIEVDGVKYWNLEGGIRPIKNFEACFIELSTLTGLVDFVKNNYGKDLPKELIIQVVSPTLVTVESTLNQFKDRECFVRAAALLPRSFSYKNFIGREEFNIALMSKFEDNGSKELIIKYLSAMTIDDTQTIKDNGTTQQAVIKTGVASVGNSVVPNPVVLAPYRTFLEVEQPASNFIFRVKQGQGEPLAALFEADGGAWRNEAIKNIKKYLQQAFAEPRFSDIQIIA